MSFSTWIIVFCIRCGLQPSVRPLPRLQLTILCSSENSVDGYAQPRVPQLHDDVRTEYDCVACPSIENFPPHRSSRRTPTNDRQLVFLSSPIILFRSPFPPLPGEWECDHPCGRRGSRVGCRRCHVILYMTSANIQLRPLHRQAWAAATGT